MRIAAAVAVSLLTFTCAAFAQENRFDFAISGSAVFSKHTSSSNGIVTDSPTKSTAFTGTFRYHFSPKHAIDVNLGNTKNSQIFFIAPNTYRVHTSITEFTADYAFSPFSIGKLHPFVFAGGGLLHFGPGNTFIDNFSTSLPVASQTALAFLYGAGADYRVWRIISVRVQYRGLFFREPDFAVPALFFTGARGHLAEPSAGIVANF
jgi:opacity protein-like surface antigen